MMKQLILRLLQSRGLALIHSARLRDLQAQAGQLTLVQGELARARAALSAERDAAARAKAALAEPSAAAAEAGAVRSEPAVAADPVASSDGAEGLSEAGAAWQNPGPSADVGDTPDRPLRFSICIPTRERHATLRSAIETVLAQTYGNFELIIQDNFSSPATREVVQSFSDPRIRYFRSDRRLAMHDNWEEALNQATGDYILFIGDDDAVMPDCLERADALLRTMRTDVLIWSSHLFYWPDCHDPAHRNLLIADVRSGSVWRDGYADDPFKANVSNSFPDRPAGTMVFDARKVAVAWYSWKGLRPYVPLYHNMTSRRVIEQVRAKCGRYFLDPTPDFASLAVNCYFSDKILFYSRSLSMSGHSGRSNGGTHGSPEAVEKAWETFLVEGNLSVNDVMPEGIPPLKWGPSLLYGCLENVRRRAFPDDRSIPDGTKEFIHYAAAAVGSEPEGEQREDCRRWVLGMAARFGVNASDLQFPSAAPYVRPHGLMNDPTGRIFYIHVDGPTAGLQTISDAVRLAESFSLQRDFPI